jgi:7-carboxy-7-deazaguanine synthase
MRVNELFVSIQGEGLDAGLPCTFVRFTACNLRCTYCDTEYAFYEGGEVSLDDVVERVAAEGVDVVCLTGGEPLLQPDLPQLMQRLLDLEHRVIVETGGSLPLDKIPSGVIKVVDVKTPGALQTDPSEQGRKRFERQHFHYPNLDLLTETDQLKFVLCDRADYEWALGFIDKHALVGRVAAILFSPVHPGLQPSDLSAWMLEDHAPARLNLQLHKYIWGAEVRGV